MLQQFKWQQILTNDDGHSSILANDRLPTLDLMIKMGVGVSDTKAECSHIQLADQVSASDVMLAWKTIQQQADTIPPTSRSFP